MEGAAAIRARKIRAFLRQSHLRCLAARGHNILNRALGSNRCPAHRLNLRHRLEFVSGFHGYLLRVPGFRVLDRYFVFHVGCSLTATIVDNSLRFVKNFSRFVLKGLATNVYNSLKLDGLAKYPFSVF
jgi:hypothetical protein